MPRRASDCCAEASAERASPWLIGREGVKPARLAEPLGPEVTSVIEEPRVRPLTSASAFAFEPAHAVYCEDRRALSPSGCAQAGAVAKSAAQSVARTKCRVIMRVSSRFHPRSHRAPAASVGALRDAGEDDAKRAVGAFLPLRLKCHTQGHVWNTSFAFASAANIVTTTRQATRQGQQAQ